MNTRADSARWGLWPLSFGARVAMLADIASPELADTSRVGAGTAGDVRPFQYTIVIDMLLHLPAVVASLSGRVG